MDGQNGCWCQTELTLVFIILLFLPVLQLISQNTAFSYFLSSRPMLLRKVSLISQGVRTCFKCFKEIWHKLNALFCEISPWFVPKHS